MRFLPDIRYRTENYPEKVARRLRALNLTTWIAAAIAVYRRRDRHWPRIPRSGAGVVESWRGQRACRVDLRVGAAASSLRDALGRTDPDLNGTTLSLQSHLAVRHRQWRADELLDGCGAQF